MSARKAGYLGTLDPLATGLLVCFFGKTTQLIRFFEDCEKEYVVTLELGKSSDTFDSSGRIITCVAVTPPSLQVLKTRLGVFVGQLWQIQPSFSAIRYQGRRSYELARLGKKIDLGKRQVEIFTLELLSYDFPTLQLKVVCSAGTYVRSLVHELGISLQTGAVMTALRRERVGSFLLQHAVHPNQAGPGDLMSVQKLLNDPLYLPALPSKDKQYLLASFSDLPASF